MSITTSDSQAADNAAIPAAVQTELASLRNDLTETRTRLSRLEQSVAIEISSLVSMDSPEMAYALELCQEVYPGCRVTPEVMTDPEDSARMWYSLNITWKGDFQELSSRDSNWHRRFEAKYPRASNDFCLSSLPE